jgi:hypothetical protein
MTGRDEVSHALDSGWQWSGDDAAIVLRAGDQLDPVSGRIDVLKLVRRGKVVAYIADSRDLGNVRFILPPRRHAS